MRKTALTLAILPTVAMLSACGQKFPDADKLKADIGQFFAAARPGAHYEITKLENLSCKTVEKTGGTRCSFDLSVTDSDVEATRRGREWFEYAADGSVVTKPDYPWKFERQNAAAKALQTNPEFAGLKTERVELSCNPNDKQPGYFCLVYVNVFEGAARPIHAAFTSGLQLSAGRWTLTPAAATLSGQWDNPSLSIRFSDSQVNLTAVVTHRCP
ncbi:hypothetical protein AJ88_22960 [Mesorhizobium amorphae CCBAU 01583]|nr:hypothetical protein AJ88_22960 [Mesorhizobium amorphae CCBAU 01583]